MIRARLSQLARRLERPYEVYNRIEVSRSALLDNLGFFSKKTGMYVIPVLKANAYGHGLEEVVSTLKGRKLPYVAVDGYFEALRVRRYSRQPVLIMGMIKPENFRKLRLGGFTFVVHDETTIHALGALNKRIKVHLELNSGMNRYGIPIRETQHYANLLKKYPKLQLEGIMTHLADADGTNAKSIDEAVEKFDQGVNLLLANGFKPKLFHVGQSAGSLRVKSRYANAVRTGISLYGINPMPADHPLRDEYKELRPALKLISSISKIQKLNKGDKVSYNYTYTAPKAMRIGVLPVGYHEGVDRALSNSGVVKIGKRFQPIVGRVCMNHTLVSLEGTNAQVGDEVMVYSNDPKDRNSIDSIANEHGLFAYRLLTGFSPDVRRQLVA